MRPVSNLILFILLSSRLSAQDALPVNHELWIKKDQLIQSHEIPVFTALKPVPDLLYFASKTSDSIAYPHFANQSKSWLYRKLFLDDLFSVDADNLKLRLNPLLSFDAGHDNNLNSMVYRNTRGVRIDGSAGRLVSFTSSFYENQAVFPAYFAQKILTSHVVPGQGLPKIMAKNGYDFAWAEGNVSILAAKNLIFELGYGKRFFGEGYRSLLLSDYAFVYPYVSYRWTKDRFFISSEVHSYVETLNLNLFDAERFPAKTATLHFIGYQWTRFQISLMESNMYANPDSLNRFHWQAEFLNPVPFLNSIANRGNNLMGINLKYYAAGSVQLYAQLALDELNWKKLSAWSSVRNKTGLQLGAKYFNAFGIENFYLQLEYNQVRPYTYSANNIALAYTHYNEPLAHPLGANFKEILTIANYQKSRWLFNAHFSYAITGLDSSNSNWGSNIFLNDRTAQLGYPSSGNYVGQGVRTNIMNSNLRIAYIINPISTLNISVGYQHRSLSSSSLSQKTDYIYLSIRTSLNNLYSDF